MTFRKILSIGICLAAIGFLFLKPLQLDTRLTTLLPNGYANDFTSNDNDSRSNRIYVVLAATAGEIYNASFLTALRDLTENIFFLPGVDRSGVTSITAHDMNFRDIIEDGFDGGTIIPEEYAYDDKGLDVIKQHVQKSHLVGQIVAYDHKSTMIVVPYFKGVDGNKLTQDIIKLFPQSNGINFSVIGQSPFVVAMQQEFNTSLKMLMFGWLLVTVLAYVFLRRSVWSMALAPVLSVVLQLALYRLCAPTLHPFVFPVIWVVVMLACLNTIWGGSLLTCAVLLLATSVYAFGSPQAMQMAMLCLTGAVGLFVTQQLFIDKTSTGMDRVRFDLNVLSLVMIFLIAMVAAAPLGIGSNEAAPKFLKANTAYKQSQQFVSKHYAFTSDMMTISTFAAGEGCTDVATVNVLEELNWCLTDHAGVRSVWSLSEGVKRINMFLHEDYIKWRTIPQERATLISATSNLDPASGLLDESGRILPVLLFMEDHDPNQITKVYDAIRRFNFSSNLLTHQNPSGMAAFEAVELKAVVKAYRNICVIFLFGLLLLTRCFFPWKETMGLCFLMVVVIAATAGFIARLGLGLDVDVLFAIVLGACVSTLLLGLSARSPAVRSKTFLMFLSGIIMAAGGLVSGVSFIYTTGLVMAWMIFVTGVLAWLCLKGSSDLLDSSATI